MRGQLTPVQEIVNLANQPNPATPDWQPNTSSPFPDYAPIDRVGVNLGTLQTLAGVCIRGAAGPVGVKLYRSSPPQPQPSYNPDHYLELASDVHKQITGPPKQRRATNHVSEQVMIPVDVRMVEQSIPEAQLRDPAAWAEAIHRALGQGLRAQVFGRIETKYECVRSVQLALLSAPAIASSNPARTLAIAFASVGAVELFRGQQKLKDLTFLPFRAERIILAGIGSRAFRLARVIPPASTDK